MWPVTPSALAAAQRELAAALPAPWAPPGPRLPVAGCFALAATRRARTPEPLRAARHEARLARAAEAAPAVVLTFDDGPGAVTEALLNVLAHHGAKATFDVLGDRIAGREALLRRMVSEGHEVGVHGWSHGDHRDDPERRAIGAARTAELVEQVCGVRPRWFRPPFGLTDARLEAAVARRGLQTLLWDVDPRDYDEPGAEAIARRILDGLRPGSVVLLHDDRPELAPTATAVDMVLGRLRRVGWRAVTVSELRWKRGNGGFFVTRAPPPARACVRGPWPATPSRGGGR